MKLIEVECFVDAPFFKKTGMAHGCAWDFLKNTKIYFYDVVAHGCAWQFSDAKKRGAWLRMALAVEKKKIPPLMVARDNMEQDHQ